MERLLLPVGVLGGFLVVLVLGCSCSARAGSTGHPSPRSGVSRPCAPPRRDRGTRRG